MNEAPNTIYLQWTGSELDEDNTWCTDQINDDDVVYVRARMTYCAHCGKEYPLDNDASEIRAHIRVCDRHPMYNLQKLLKEAFELIDEEYGNGIKNGYWPSIAPLYFRIEEELKNE